MKGKYFGFLPYFFRYPGNFKLIGFNFHFWPFFFEVYRFKWFKRCTPKLYSSKGKFNTQFDDLVGIQWSYQIEGSEENWKKYSTCSLFIVFHFFYVYYCILTCKCFILCLCNLLCQKEMIESHTIVENGYPNVNVIITLFIFFVVNIYF